MSNYLFAYRGGNRPTSEEERQATIAEWGRWFGELGDAVVDAGNPLAAESASVTGDSVSEGAQSELRGDSVVRADSLSAASELAKGCPVLSDGGAVEVYETVEIEM